MRVRDAKEIVDINFFIACFGRLKGTKRTDRVGYIAIKLMETNLIFLRLRNDQFGKVHKQVQKR